MRIRKRTRSTSLDLVSHSCSNKDSAHGHSGKLVLCHQSMTIERRYCTGQSRVGLGGVSDSCTCVTAGTARCRWTHAVTPHVISANFSTSPKLLSNCFLAISHFKGNAHLAHPAWCLGNETQTTQVYCVLYSVLYCTVHMHLQIDGLLTF